MFIFSEQKINGNSRKRLGEMTKIEKKSEKEKIWGTYGAKVAKREDTREKGSDGRIAIIKNKTENENNSKGKSKNKRTRTRKTSKKQQKNSENKSNIDQASCANTR